MKLVFQLTDQKHFIHYNQAFIWCDLFLCVCPCCSLQYVFVWRGHVCARVNTLFMLVFVCALPVLVTATPMLSLWHFPTFCTRTSCHFPYVLFYASSLAATSITVNSGQTKLVKWPIMSHSSATLGLGLKQWSSVHQKDGKLSQLLGYVEEKILKNGRNVHLMIRWTHLKKYTSSFIHWHDLKNGAA